MSSFWIEPYRKHFQKHFQKPFDIEVFYDRDGFGLKLATHDLARNGFRVYASLGLADRLVQNEEEEFGEVFLFSDVPDKEVPRLFVNALFFILHNDIPLGSRFAIGIEMRPDFARRYGKTALYFTRPAADVEEFNELHEEDKVGRVFQAFFITPEEDEFLEQHGADAFEREFWKQFSDESADDERRTRSVDLKDFEKEVEARGREVEQRTTKALSLRRPSCV